MGGRHGAAFFESQIVILELRRIAPVRRIARRLARYKRAESSQQHVTLVLMSSVGDFNFWNEHNKNGVHQQTDAKEKDTDTATDDSRWTEIEYPPGRDTSCLQLIVPFSR